MKNGATYETKRIDHWGIVVGICREISLAAHIDAEVDRCERRVSCGQAVVALVLNALGFSGRAIYLMPDYLMNKPVDVLIDPSLTAADFNDDTLGRSLDDLRPESNPSPSAIGYRVRSYPMRPGWLKPNAR